MIDRALVERILERYAGRQYPIDPGPDDVFVASGEAFLLARYRDGTYYVQHVWGKPGEWRNLFRLLAQELIARGHGRVPVRWKLGGVVARLAGRLLPVRTVPYVGDSLLAEYTAEEALPRL